MAIRRAVPFIMVLLFFFFLLPLNAQEGPDDEEEERPPESIWTDLPQSMVYQYGDQIFSVSLGAAIPLGFFGPTGKFDNNFSVGGAGILSYELFINSNIAFGADVMGLFASTIGKNMYYLIPIGVKATYQLVINSFEFPFSLGFGMAPQKYLDGGFFGAYAKASVGAYWRFRNDWSFGFNFNYLLVPQWAKTQEETAYGNFFIVNASARFHL